MNLEKLSLLTPKERETLRLLAQERDQKTVARLMAISPETVKSHLRNAREKTSAPTSFQLARALLVFERPTLERGITPERGGSLRPAMGSEGVPDRPEIDQMAVKEVHEERAVFEIEALPATSGGETGGGPEDANALHRLMLAGVLLLILIIAIVLAFPLADSFQRFADIIDPPNN